MTARTTRRGAAALAAALTIALATPSLADTQGGWDAFYNGDYQTAFEMFSDPAENGDPSAQYGLALMFSDGLGVPQDRAAAVEWLEQSALQGNDQAMVNLGFHIDLGLGTQRDPDLAEYWYERATEYGNLMAQNNLAYMWALDQRNLEQALKLIEEVVRLVPEESSYLDTLGWVHYQMGQFQRAVNPICDAVMLEPGHPELRIHLGDVYWQLGRTYDAQHQWQRGLILLEEPEALSETGADFAEGLGAEIAAQLNQRLAEGLPMIPGSPGAAGDSADLPITLPDECSVPVV